MSKVTFSILTALSLAPLDALHAADARVVVYPPLPNNAYQSLHYEVTVEQNGQRFPSYVYQSDNRGDLDAYHLQRMTAANHFTSFSLRFIKAKNGITKDSQ